MKYLETLGEDSRDKQKTEYSLTQHLANNLIDMYINLPSKNNYRRPASYTSKGYHTRRMAVDFAVPLITNVKNAKLLAEALVRRLPLDVSNVDCKSSHRTHTFPGFVNVAAFVPKLVVKNSVEMIEMTKASISGGFTTAITIPLDLHSTVTDSSSLEIAKQNVVGHAHSNFAMTITATSSNVHLLDEEVQADAKALFIPISTPLSVVAAHFSSWPSDKPVITDAKGSELASILLLASLHNRSLHITDIQTSDDLLLISLSKAKQLKVTCDVSVYSLFFAREQFSNTVCLPSADDQKVIWQKLDLIDVFSVGSSPYYLSEGMDKIGTVWSGMEEAVILLLTAVNDGRLTLDGIRRRLHDNPVHIFGLPDQTHTHVEVVIGRKALFSKRARYWSPLEGKTIAGSIHRVVLHGQTVFLDGNLSASSSGKDVSSATVTHLSGPKDAEVSQVPITTLQSSQSAVQTHTPGPHISSQLRPRSSFLRRHILSVKQFTGQDLYDLFSLAQELQLQVERSGTLDVLKGKVLCTVFYEPSTRTSSSFDAAMKRCGGEVVQISADTSSVVKGETLADTIRTLGCYGDAIVIRHPDVGSAQEAAKFSPVPVINAGDGIGEHPTQV